MTTRTYNRIRTALAVVAVTFGLVAAVLHLAGYPEASLQIYYWVAFFFMLRFLWFDNKRVETIGERVDQSYAEWLRSRRRSTS